MVEVKTVLNEGKCYFIVTLGMKKILCTKINKYKTNIVDNEIAFYHYHFIGFLKCEIFKSYLTNIYIEENIFCIEKHIMRPKYII